MISKRIKTLGLLLFGALSALAQTQGEPFFLVRVVRSAPKADGDTSAIDPYRNAKVPIDVLGMKSITGSSQTWLIESHRSFAGIESMDKVFADLSSGAPDRNGIEDEAFSPSTRMIGLFRAGLSYRPDEALKLLQTSRYFQVSIFRIRPGADVDFAELIHLRKQSFDVINLDRPEIGYQVISGSTSGTYIFLAPLPSLRTLDNGIARMPVSEVLAGHQAAKAGRQIAYEADITREHLLFRVQPRLSHVSDSFAAADPDFWRGAR